MSTRVQVAVTTTRDERSMAVLGHQQMSYPTNGEEISDIRSNEAAIPNVVWFEIDR